MQSTMLERSFGRAGETTPSVRAGARSPGQSVDSFTTARLDHYMPVPEGSSLTAGKGDLGRRLFFDRRLSRDQ